MSDTPETDEAFAVFTEGPHDDAGDPWALASRLERERNNARKELDQLKHQYRKLAGHHNQHCTCLEIY
jgi:hypothetical protein